MKGADMTGHELGAEVGSADDECMYSVLKIEQSAALAAIGRSKSRALGYTKCPALADP